MLRFPVCSGRSKVNGIAIEHKGKEAAQEEQKNEGNVSHVLGPLIKLRREHEPRFSLLWLEDRINTELWDP